MNSTMSSSDYTLSLGMLLLKMSQDEESNFSPDALQRDFRGDSSFDNLISSAVSRLQKWSKLDQFLKSIEIRVKHKDDIAAKALRKEGNSYYMKSNLKMALMKYNESIKFSPHPPMEDVSDEMQNSSFQDLPFAYANRAAVYFEMGLYDEACTDIRRALRLGYSRQKQKLSVRYCKSLIYIHLKKNPQSAITSSVFNTVFEKYEEDLNCSLDDDQKIQITEHQFDVKKAAIYKSRIPKYIEVPKPVLDGEHPQIPGLSNKVEFAARVKRGRYLIAGEDIYPGTVLAIDPGFIVATVDPEFVGEYCSACSKPCDFIFVPCHQCTSAVFCNEKCRDEAFKMYHCYECSVLPIFDTLQMGNKSYLTLRIIASLGYSELENNVNVFEREEEVKKPSMAKRGFSSEGVYDLKSYRTVYYLTNHKELRESKDLMETSCMAVVMTFILKKYTTFFGEENLSSEESVNNLHFNESEMLIAKLILRHLMSMPINANPNSSCEKLFCVWNLKTIGDNLHCLFSLLGHSCNPNAFIADSSTLRSIAFIPKGTEICFNYQMKFTKASKEVRQADLTRQYFFTCDCIACVEDWQLGNPMDGMSNISVKCVFGCKSGILNKRTLRCTKCSKGLKKEKSLYSESYLKHINGIIYGSSSENSKSVKRDIALTSVNIFTELDSQMKSTIQFQTSDELFSNSLKVIRDVAYNAFKGIYLFDTYCDCPTNYMLYAMREFSKCFYDSISNRVAFE